MNKKDILEIVLYITAIPGILSCSIEVCLTWKIQNSSLVLNCKIHNMQFQVFFVDPNNTEQAFCVQPIRQPILHTECIPLGNNVTVSQNVSTNETILIKYSHIDSGLNGIWTCKHGTSSTEATAEVTIVTKNVPINGSKEKNCEMQFLFWTFVGSTVGTLVVISVLLSFAAVILIIMTIVVPCLIGYHGNASCEEQRWFIAFGLVFSLIAGFLLYLTKTGSRANEDNQEGSQCEANEEQKGIEMEQLGSQCEANEEQEGIEIDQLGTDQVRLTNTRTN